MGANRQVLPASGDSPDSRSTGGRTGLGRGVLAIAGLSTLAIAQPVYDLLRRTPEFFAIRQLAFVDIAVLVALAAIGPALVLSVPAAAVRLFRPAWVRPAVAAAAGLLVGTIALQAVRGLPAAAAGTVALATCAAVAWAYLRLPAFRSLALLVAGATVVAPAVLVLDGDVRRALAGAGGAALPGSGGARAPIVLAVFDEWSMISILDAEGAIDRRRFPNLARFADRATWYPNATAASNMTNHAVPAMLTGSPPERGRLPTAADHAVNLFTLLAPSHDIFAMEPVTSLCPPDRNLLEDERPPFGQRFGLLLSDLRFVWLSLTLPEPWAERIPPLDRTWSGFDRATAEAAPSTPGDRQLARAHPHRRNDERVNDFRRFMDSIRPPGARPGLYFTHVLLPHAPWEYLPSGRRYSRSRAYGLRDGTWTSDAWTVKHHQKRYLLQLQFVDRLIGELLEKLDALDLFDRSLVVIAADHGLSFQPGRSLRLPAPDPSGGQILDLVAVPLIVKAPFQDRPEIDRGPISLVDLTPLMLELAGDAGNTGMGRARGGASPLWFSEHGAEIEVPAERDSWRRSRLAEQTALLGESNDPAGIGSLPELHGRPVSELAVRAGATRARLELPHVWDDIDLEATLLPAVVEAFLVDRKTPPDRPVVVAVNGIVADTVHAHFERGRTRVSAILPEPLLHPGHNRIDLFLATDRDGELELERLDSPEAFAYRVDSEYRYEAVRGGEGLIEGLRRSSVRDQARASETLPVAPPSRDLLGYLDATVPEGPAAGGRSLFRLNGRASDAVNTGRSNTVVTVVGSEATAFSGPALRDNGFTLRLAADREQVEREGIVAFAVGHGGVATRLRFSYRPLERGRGGREIVPVSDGRRLPVHAPGDGFDGAVDRVAALRRGTSIAGWAADLERAETARQVVIYRDGEFLANVGRSGPGRPDVVEQFDDPRLLRTGFRGNVPGAPLPSVFTERHRVFGVMLRGRAVELPVLPASGDAR